MRLLILAFSIAGLLPVATLATAGKVHAQTSQECTGENCPKPGGQGGRDCESKENTVS